MRSFANIRISRIHAALYQPPKVASWIIEDPNYPQVDYRKRPLPTGVFFLRGLLLARHSNGSAPSLPWERVRGYRLSTASAPLPDFLRKSTSLALGPANK